MKSKYLLIYIILLFLCAPVWAEQPEHNILFPVIVKGEQLQQLQGKNIENIRVFAFQNGSPSVIPFQIDQKDSNNNWVWDVVVNSNGYKTNDFDNEDPQGKKIFDNNDQLIFMAADVGEKTQIASLKINATYILELEVFVNESVQPLGWIYITYHYSSVPSLSNTRYMSYQPEQKLITSPVYSLTYSDHFIAAIDDMSIAGQSIINQTRIQGKVDVGFLLFNSSIEFNEKEIGGYLVGYINGPIRITKRFINFINLGSGIKSRSLTVDHLFYPNHTEIPILISKGFLVKNITIKIGANYPDTNSIQSIKTLKDMNVHEQEASIIQNNPLQLLAVNSPYYSMFSMINIPKKLRSKINSYAYINNDLSAKLPKGLLAGKNKQAGFYLETMANFPSGQYQLNIISIFSNKPHLYERDNYFKNLVHNKISILTKEVQKKILSQKNNSDINPGYNVINQLSLLLPQ